MNSHMKWGAILAYANLFAKTVAQLLYIPLLVQLLGKEEYGIYTVALSVASYLTILNLGIDSSYIHFFSKAATDKNPNATSKLNATYLTIFVTLGALALVVGFGLTMALHWIFPDFTVGQIDHMRSMLVLLTINVALSFPLGLFNSYVVAHEKHIVVKLTALLISILNPVISILALLFGGGAIVVVAVTVATNIISYLIMAVYAITVLKFRLQMTKGQHSSMKGILSFSYLIFIQIIAEQTNWNIDKILLGRYKDPGAVAVYGIASQLQTMYMSIALAISGLFTPRIHRLVTEKAHQEVNALFIKVGTVQFLVLGLVMSGFILFGRTFIQLWVGLEYSDAYIIALLLMLPATVDLIQNTGIEIQRAMGLQKDRAIVYAIVSVLNLMISIPLCKIWGGIGCAVGTAVSFLVCNILYMNFYYKKKMHLDIGAFWKAITKMAAPTVAVAVFGYVLQRNVHINNFMTLGIGAIVYTIFYFVANMITNPQLRKFVVDIFARKNRAQKT